MEALLERVQVLEKGMFGGVALFHEACLVPGCVLHTSSICLCCAFFAPLPVHWTFLSSVLVVRNKLDAEWCAVWVVHVCMYVSRF